MTAKHEGSEGTVNSRTKQGSPDILQKYVTLTQFYRRLAQPYPSNLSPWKSCTTPYTKALGIIAVSYTWLMQRRSYRPTRPPSPSLKQRPSSLRHRPFKSQLQPKHPRLRARRLHEGFGPGPEPKWSLPVSRDWGSCSRGLGFLC